MIIKNFRGFTLVEIVMVVIIMGIILSMTIFFGSNYLKELQLRKEKEGLLNTVQYAMSYVKSTNYYQGEKFDNIAVGLSTTGVSLSLNGLTGTGFSTFGLTRSAIIFTGTTSSYITLYPYQRACYDEINGTNTGIVQFQLQSTVSDNLFCFERDMELCKIFSVSCP